MILCSTSSKNEKNSRNISYLYLMNIFFKLQFMKKSRFFLRFQISQTMTNTADWPLISPRDQQLRKLIQINESKLVFTQNLLKFHRHTRTKCQKLFLFTNAHAFQSQNNSVTRYKPNLMNTIVAFLKSFWFFSVSRN